MLYTISHNNSKVSIDSKGAELKSFLVDNKEYMHDSNPKYWGRTAPNLFPNIGTIKDGYVIIDKKEYKFSKHGFLRDTEMSLHEQKENYISFILNSDEKTHLIYPYEFKLIISYLLLDQTLTVKLFVKNEGLKPLYFNFGLHPAFKIPWNENEHFEDYKIVFEQPITSTLPTVLLDSGLIDWKKEYKKLVDVNVIPLNHEDYSHDALCIEPYPKGEIKIISPKNESISLSAPGFKTLGIWTPYPTKAPFICLEPWHGCADTPESNHLFEEKKDLIKLKENEIWLNTYQIKIN